MNSLHVSPLSLEGDTQKMTHKHWLHFSTLSNCPMKPLEDFGESLWTPWVKDFGQRERESCNNARDPSSISMPGLEP